MTILLAILVALVWWVVAWGVGIKGFDALMLSILIVLIACGWYMIRPYLPGYREDPDEPRSGGGWTVR